MSDEDRVSTVPRSRPKSRPRLEGSKTKTKTKTEVPRPRPEPRLRGSRPRPRPRLVTTGLETSRDQDSSLENSKSGEHLLS